MGGRPTSYVWPPSHLVFYKRASSLHFFTPHTSHFSRQTLGSRPPGVQREFGENESLERVEKRKEIWESEQELKS
jgi:hypothetical protein